MLAIIIPSAVGMLILAHPLIDLVLAHGAATTADAEATGAALAMFSLGLPGFCTFLYMVRVFQAMQDTRTAFRLYLVENALNVAFAVALVGPLGVRGLALSLSIAYSVAALLALSVVRRRVGGLGGDDLTTPVKRVVGASAVMGVATVLTVNISAAPSGFGLAARLALAVVVGALAYLATAGILGARAARRTIAARTERARARADAAGRTRPGLPTGDDSPSPEPFHERLDDHAVGPPYRHLRPVSAGPGDRPGPGDEIRPGQEEEEFDGPHTGGD